MKLFQRKCKHKNLIPIIDEGVYLYSHCHDCGKRFSDLKQGLIHNFTILGVDFDYYAEYKNAHNINLPRFDLERKARGL